MIKTEHFAKGADILQHLALLHTNEGMATRIGDRLADVLELKEARDGNGSVWVPRRWNTAYGTKTSAGLARTVLRILLEDE